MDGGGGESCVSVSEAVTRDFSLAALGKQRQNTEIDVNIIKNLLKTRYEGRSWNLAYLSVSLH